MYEVDIKDTQGLGININGTPFCVSIYYEKGDPIYFNKGDFSIYLKKLIKAGEEAFGKGFIEL